MCKEEYNSEPVVYCKQCLSLRIMDANGTDFCDDCFGTELGTTTIEEWEILYELKYGHKFLEYGRE